MKEDNKCFNQEEVGKDSKKVRKIDKYNWKEINYYPSEKDDWTNLKKVI